MLEDTAAGIEAVRQAGMRAIGIGRPETLPGVQPVDETLAHVTADQILRE